MKIQNRSSVLNTGIWKISDMSQTQEKQSAVPASQTESIAKLPSEAQHNRQLNEFKSQEQLVRSSIQQKLSFRINAQEFLNGKKVDKPMDGPMSVDQMGRRLRRVQEMMNHFEELGSSTWNEEEAKMYATLQKERNSLMEALRTSNGNQREVVSEGEDGPPTMGARPSRRQNEIIIADDNFNPVATGLNYPSIVGTPGRGRWRSAASNRTNNDANYTPRNQKSDTGPKNVDYSTGTNSLNDSHSSSTDNRSYNPGKPEPKTNDGSGYENNTHDDQNDIDIVSPAGYAPGEYPTLSGDDPMTGHGGSSGNDVGVSGRIPKGSPDNRTGIQQIVQPAINVFSTTTGADDKERPDTGKTQGTVWNASEGDDLGDDLPYRLSGSGGGIDVEAGKVLLEQIRPINPGEPDPTKR